GGTLPWRLPADLQYFHDITSGQPPAGKINAVIMGRKTWESIPTNKRPLPNRINIVISGNKIYQVPEGVLLVESLQQALAAADIGKEINELFVIGGGQVFAEAIAKPECVRLYITEVDTDVGADTFFPAIPKDYKLTESSKQISQGGYTFRFNVYERKSRGLMKKYFKEAAETGLDALTN
ncbi:dihydrofolate reductase, partial [Patescibacteria group bacterium]